ncbi:Ornithine decarboxylase [Araneus ventricosus]|uniref:Ornithine decarboxylase n=1 Tax=Araneus ventricosus TaxID=182803 RepID=A0A4Y2HD55_ARAVE|nr:Ornithine decarboxylase [Araneus ventricosus]
MMRAQFCEKTTIIVRHHFFCNFYCLIHHPWLNHDQQLNDGSAIIMRKLTEMRRQMYTPAGCCFGMVSQFLRCWRFLKLPSAFKQNEFLANSPVRLDIFAVGTIPAHNSIMDPGVLAEIERLCSIADQKDEDAAFLVFDLSETVERVKNWKLAMPRVDPYYAIKCNNDPLLLRTLAALNFGFDCSSKAEMDMIINLGVPPDRILYANTCKGFSHLRHAAHLNVSLMTFDSEEELLKIKQTFPTAKLLIRLRVKQSSAKIPTTDTSGCEERDVPALLEAALIHNLSVVGVSFHIGSLVQDPNDFATAIKMCGQVFEIAERKGILMDILDIGGGFPGSKSSQDLFAAIAVSVNKAIDTHFPPDGQFQIIAEPGRCIVTTAFTLCSSIIGKKERYVDNDTEIMYIINEGVYGLFVHTIFHSDETKPTPKTLLPGVELKPSSIWGQSCDPVDLIVKRSMIPELKVGDWLLIEEMGAYTTSCASTYCGFEKTEVKYIVSQETL